MRKFLIVIIIVVVVLILGAIFLVIFRKAPVPEARIPEFPEYEKMATPTKALVSADLSLISDSEILDYWVTKDTQEVFYINKAGQIFKANLGKDNLIYETNLNNLRKIIPSPSGSQVLLGFGKPWELQFSVYNLAKNEFIPLPLEIKQAVFSPDEKKLLVLVKTETSSNLEIFDLTDKTSKVLIKDFALKDLNFNWLTSEYIYFYGKPSSIAEAIWRYDLKNKKLSQITPEEPELLVKFLSSSSILKSQNKKTRLINLDGEIVGSFDYYILPQKCGISDNLLCCFVPKTSIKNRVESYLKQEFYSDDNLHCFDLKKIGKKMELVKSFSGIDASNVTILGETIYFKNRVDSKIYSTKLD